jgi:GNAT superfamily N-acetyltransferase
MLAAWLDDKPVGRVLVHWRPVPETPAEWHTGFAFLEELIVLEAHRSQGIGTAIKQEAERLARERGFTTVAVGVGVGVDNARARVLYERLGYVDAGLGSFEDRGTFLNSRGEQIDWHETWLFLTRVL